MCQPELIQPLINTFIGGLPQYLNTVQQQHKQGIQVCFLK
jgi:hypothetical protein